MVALSKTWDKQQFPHELPDDWRNVRHKNQKTSSENFKELAYYYGEKGSGPSKYESNKENRSLGQWLYDKKNRSNPHEESDNKTWADMVALSKTWDKQEFPHELPENWRNVKPKNALQERDRKNSSERLEELAYYYGEKGSGPSQTASNKKDKSLGQWLYDKKNRSNPHEESDNKTWADMVALSKTSGWIDPVTGERFKFFPLPNDWREIKPAGEKSLGEKLVANILKELEIKNEPEYRDNACKNKRCLPFDFLITHNGRKYLEFHGEQHYVPTYFGSGEEKTEQIIAKHAIDKFEIQKKNDTKKYEHCVKENIPFLVIPYWLYKNPDIIKSKIIEFLNTNQFNETFANPVVPPKYKEYHDKMYAKYLAKSKPTELVEPKPTFEQFLINKNFINI